MTEMYAAGSLMKSGMRVGYDFFFLIDITSLQTLKTDKQSFFFSTTCSTHICSGRPEEVAYVEGGSWSFQANGIYRTSLVNVASPTDNSVMLRRFDACALWTRNQHNLDIPSKQPGDLACYKQQRKDSCWAPGRKGRNHCRTQVATPEEDHVLSTDRQAICEIIKKRSKLLQL